MRNILKIASLLDYSGQYHLSDKLFKIAQQDHFDYTLDSDTPEKFFMNLTGYQNTKRLNNYVQSMNSYAAENATYKGVPIRDIPAFQQYFHDLRDGYDSNLSDIIEEFASDPNKKPKSIFERVENLPGQNTPYKSSAQAEADKFQDKRYFLINTTDPATFAKSLFEFGSMYRINNLTQAFGAYADAGASYQGNLIKNVPVLRELYMRVRNTPKAITQQELVQELTMLTTPQRTTSNLPIIDFNTASPDQIFENITMRINNSQNEKQLEAAKTYIWRSQRTLSETQLGSLNGLANEKAAEIAENDATAKKDSQDLGTYWYQAVMREPLNGLETLKTEVQKDQELNESQKTNLIKIIDQRIMNRR